MVITKFQKFLLFLFLLLFFDMQATQIFSEQQKTKEIFVGKVVDAAQKKIEVTITINRWTTDAERDQLLSILLKDGTNKTVDELENQKETGYFRIEDSLGYALRYAREFREQGKRKIVLATNRPMSFGEQWKSGRSQDYRLSLIELLVDEQGNGVGTIAPAVKLKVDQANQTFEVENFKYSPYPIESIKKKQ